MSPSLVVSYVNPSLTVPLAVTVVQSGTTLAWSPSAQKFTAAPADALIPLSSVGGPNLTGVYTAVVGGVPAPAIDGGYMVFVHPAFGGPPVDINGIPVGAAPLVVGVPRSFASIVKGP